MAGKTIEYKGEKAKIIMVGRQEQVPGWKGELCVAVIQYRDKFDVVPDSTHPDDQADLPEVKTFTDRGLAISHFFKLENNKKNWK